MREGFAAGRGGDDGDELELRKRAPRDVHALSIGSGVGRGEVQAGIGDKVFEQCDIGWGKTFEKIAGTKRHAKPEAFGAGPREEGAAGEALGVGGVGQIEVADVADVLYIGGIKHDDSPAKVQQVDSAAAHKRRQGEVAREDLPGKTPNDNLFVSG